MLRNMIRLFFAIVMFGAIAYLLYERDRMKQESAVLRGEVQQLKKEAQAEKEAWSKLFKDCIEEKDALVSKLKDLTTTQAGSSSN